MNWSQFFAQLVMQLAVSSLTLAAVAYLAKALIAQQLAKDLEAFKRQLAIEAERDRIRFSKLHERRAEIIEKLYQQLDHITGMLGLQSGRTTNTSEISDHLTKEVVSLGHYYRQHALYFPTSVREKFERVFIRGLPKAILALHGIGDMEKFEVLFRECRGKEVDLVGGFLTGLKEHLPTLIQLSRDLEQEFQAILGVSAGEANRHS